MFHSFDSGHQATTRYSSLAILDKLIEFGWREVLENANRRGTRGGTTTQSTLEVT